jgi:hypothetical protein
MSSLVRLNHPGLSYTRSIQAISEIQRFILLLITRKCFINFSYNGEVFRYNDHPNRSIPP